MKPGFRTYELAIEFARACRQIRVPYDLKDQLSRASASIPLNISEGSARPSPKERHRFYRIALGSFRESEAILDILDIQSESINSLRNTLGACLTKLCKNTR